ncbi:MAG: CHAT domain-containing protein/Tfp pilus assembly protein PilF [Rhodothermales bacterium]|jgi:CHAT domain-containing protein/Tfp pilus assembly protein PilF
MRFILGITIVLLAGCNSDEARPAASSGTSSDDHLETATTLIAEGELGPAELALESALQVSGPDSARVRGLVQIALGEIQLRRGNYRSAELMLADLTRYADVFGRPSAIRAQVLRTRALVRLGQYEEALGVVESALASAEQEFGVDHDLVGAALHYRALALHESGNLIRALNSYWPAVEVRTRVHGKYSREVAATYNNIGNVYWRLGLFDRALETHQSALAIKEEILSASDPEIAITLGNLANLLAITRDSSRAEFYYQEALRIYSARESNPLFLAKTRDNYGELLMANGRIEEAEVHLRAANLAFHRLLPPGHGSIGVSEVHIGKLELLQGKSQGLDRLERGTRVMIQAGRPDAAYEVGSLAESLMAQGLTTRALAALDRGMDLMEVKYSEHHPNLLRLTNIRARYLLAERSFHAARNLLSENLERALQWNTSPTSDAANSRDRLSQGDFVDSIQLWSQSLEGVHSAGELEGTELRNESRRLLSLVRMLETEASFETGFGDGTKIRPLGAVVRAAQELHLGFLRRDPSRANLDIVFQLAEMSLAGKLHAASARSAASGFGHVPAAMVARERRLLSGLSLSQRELQAWSHASGGDPSPSLVRRYYAYRDSIAQHLAVLHRQYPRYHSMRFATGTAGIGQVQKSLGPRNLFQYHIVGDTLFGIIVGGEDVSFSALGPIAGLTTQIDRYLRALQEGDTSTALRDATLLYDQIVAPLSTHATSDQWVIVPDGPLLNLPFEALVNDSLPAGSTGRPRYLVEDITILYAYSGTLFSQLQPDRSNAKDKTILIAAPVFSGGIDFPGTALGMPDDRAVHSFGELRGTGREAVAIDRLFDQERHTIQGSVEVLLDRAASERAVKESARERFRYLHFATHGYASPSHPNMSGLLFQPGDGEDGILHVGEVLGMELNAEMVVLSACRTATSGSQSGTGLMGLGQAFLYAGTQTVVASLWNSDDAYTAATMAHFYKNILAGQPKAEALRQAKLKLMEDPEVAARPSLWAPFIMIGQS